MMLFVDTGVLLRLFDHSAVVRSRMWSSIKRSLRAHERALASAQNIAEFWNVSTRPLSARGGMGHPIGRVRYRAQALERFCDVLTETQASYQIWRELVASQGVTGTSVHDARLVAIMLDRGIADILTMNPTDFRRYPINVLTPGQMA